MSSRYLRQFEQVKPADIEWNNDIPFSREFDDIYFNPEDGLAESEYVFLQGNQLPSDWLNLHKTRFKICELGFGSGLNFILTADRWLKAISDREDSDTCHLHYISIEKRPFQPEDFLRASQHWPEFSDLTKQLFSQYPSLTYGRHQLHFKTHNVTLTLFLMPVEDALADLVTESIYQENKIAIDHWYFDGFAPAKNEAMWNEKLCQQVARLSNRNTKLATFSVSAAVKKPLVAAGFKLTKRKGFGRKREMLTASFSGAPAQSQNKYVNLKYESPWQQISLSDKTKKVAVIGAGIAGCATTFELTRAGFKVDLFDSSSSIADKASGAAAGIFHPQLTTDMNISSQLNWLGYLYLLRFLQSLSEKEKDLIIVNSSIEKLLPNEKAQNQLLTMVKNLGINHWIKPARKLKKSSAVSFPHATALDIQSLCSLLIEKSGEQNCDVFLKHEIESLERTRKGNTNWQLKTNGKTHSYQHVILCGGANSQLVDQFLKTETNTTRGQTCLFNSESLARELEFTICEQHYLVPRKNNEFHLGATFEEGENKKLDIESQKSLLVQTDQLMKELNLPFLTENAIEELPLQGTLGFRRHSLDRSPIIGAAVDDSALKTDFSNLGQTRILREDMHHYNLSGLWINTAYGSHGLIYALLGSRHLVSLINNDLSPIGTEISKSISPTRFIIRNLKSQIS